MLVFGVMNSCFVCQVLQVVGFCVIYYSVRKVLNGLDMAVTSSEYEILFLLFCHIIYVICESIYFFQHSELFMIINIFYGRCIAVSPAFFMLIAQYFPLESFFTPFIYLYSWVICLPPSVRSLGYLEIFLLGFDFYIFRLDSLAMSVKLSLVK